MARFILLKVAALVLISLSSITANAETIPAQNWIARLGISVTRDAADPPGQMPWPLVRDEPAGFSQSLHEVAFEDYLDDEQPPVRRFRSECRHDKQTRN